MLACGENDSRIYYPGGCTPRGCQARGVVFAAEEAARARGGVPKGLGSRAARAFAWRRPRAGVVRALLRTLSIQCTPPLRPRPERTVGGRSGGGGVSTWRSNRAIDPRLTRRRAEDRPPRDLNACVRWWRLSSFASEPAVHSDPRAPIVDGWSVPPSSVGRVLWLNSSCQR